MEEAEIKNMQKDITRKYHTSQQTFPNASDEERESLQHFSFLCMLSFDVYVKKQLIEKMIDARAAKESKPSEKHAKKN